MRRLHWFDTNKANYQYTQHQQTLHFTHENGRKVGFGPANLVTLRRTRLKGIVGRFCEKAANSHRLFGKRVAQPSGLPTSPLAMCCAETR